jgi:hypothetical protein
MSTIRARPAKPDARLAYHLRSGSPPVLMRSIHRFRHKVPRLFACPDGYSVRHFKGVDPMIAPGDNDGGRR